MGTLVAIDAVAASVAGAREAIESAFAAVLDVDRLMHPRRSGSDVAAINTAPPGTPIEIHRATWEVLCLAKQVNEASRGIFDPCDPTCRGRLSDIQLGSGLTVVCRASVALDLGGIAKGYAVDRAVDALRAAGCICGLVNAGGDLRVFGTPQTIFLKDGPDTRPLELVDSALAVSDVDALERPSEHRGYYAETSTEPPLACRYAAVLASEAAIADALTKCVLLCPAEVVESALSQFGATVIR